MSFSDVTENAILALIFNATTWANYAINATSSPETNIIAALHTADPGDAGTQSTSESAYSSYARQNIARTTGGFTAPSSGSTAFAANVDFPASGASGTTVTFGSLGKSGGRWWATFNSPAPIAAGDHEITVPLNGPWTSVYVMSAAKNITEFTAAKAKAGRVGFTLGGGDGYGHGVRATGPAKFTILDFKVE